jgi:hypothetical protein
VKFGQHLMRICHDASDQLRDNRGTLLGGG